MASEEPDDQYGTLQVALINGALCKVTPAIHKTIAPSANVYVFTKTYSFHRAGTTMIFKKGPSYMLDDALKAALLAVSAPMVAA